MDILIMGLSKCGKSSIKKVVFEKLSPHEAIFLEPTMNIETFKVENLGYSSLYVRDYPPNYNFDSAPSIEFKYIADSGVLVYVIDCNEPADETYDYFKEIIINTYNKNPKISVEIFIHKTDGTYFTKNNDKNKLRTEIQNRV
jgi:Ras-related GTP-binding protein C/D